METLPSPEVRMAQYVQVFLDPSTTYYQHHLAVIGMSKLPGKEDIEVNLSATDIARYTWRMQKFGWQHGLRNPDCDCMSG